MRLAIFDINPYSDSILRMPDIHYEILVFASSKCFLYHGKKYTFQDDALVQVTTVRHKCTVSHLYTLNQTFSFKDTIPLNFVHHVKMQLI